GKQTKANLLSKSEEHAHSSGLDLETKIFSASGRGRTFFLTSLFIELIEPERIRYWIATEKSVVRSYR
ncbi:MAG TPA: hypothetical protein VK638_51075, partial [Edaphobacter sp.]|nr:hypothetical protein [Edaphobacter sp.]